jgi:hypothetical protein
MLQSVIRRKNEADWTFLTGQFVLPSALHLLSIVNALGLRQSVKLKSLRGYRVEKFEIPLSV